MSVLSGRALTCFRTRAVPARVMFTASLLAAACSPGAGDARGQAPVEDVSQATSPAAPSVAVPAFDANAAFALLRTQVEFGPRVPGTAPHARQLEWMTGLLRAHADTVVLQAFTHQAAGGKTLQLTNVIARFNANQQRRILLLTHWDTRPVADQDPDESRRLQPVPGANDGASGVAVLLQLAATLSTHAAPIGVDLLFTDGEDYGPGDMYLGATYFAANAGTYRPLYGILLDMVGDRNPLFPIEGNSQELAPDVVQRVWGLAQEIGLGMMFPPNTGAWVTDDHLPLNRAGIPAINIIDFDYGPANGYWHTLDDDLQNVSPRGLGGVGTLLSELIYRGG
jgi:Zn-dependent M28 family amino/carboxypeptidase